MCGRAAAGRCWSRSLSELIASVKLLEVALELGLVREPAAGPVVRRRVIADRAAASPMPSRSRSASWSPRRAGRGRDVGIVRSLGAGPGAER